MTLEQAILDLTAKTPHGGHFWVGRHFILVRCGSDWWEWEYRGNSFYDPKDLAEDVLRRSASESRLVRFFTGRIPDQRRVPRAPMTARTPLSPGRSNSLSLDH